MGGAKMVVGNTKDGIVSSPGSQPYTYSKYLGQGDLSTAGSLASERAGR